MMESRLFERSLLALTVPALSVSLLLPGCRAAPPIEGSQLLSSEVNALDQERTVLVYELSSLEAILLELGRIRDQAVKKYGYFLIIPEVRSRYDAANEHFCQLLGEIHEKQRGVVSATIDCDECRNWVKETHAKLEVVFNFVIHFSVHKKCPSGWVPPDGFEYLRNFD
jgi:hypothetical protein